MQKLKAENCHSIIRIFRRNPNGGSTQEIHDTMEKMEKALDFWEFSYREKYFVRWAVVDKKCGCAIGTIELFHRDAADEKLAGQDGTRYGDYYVRHEG